MSEAYVINGYELERDIKIGELADSLGGVVLKEEIKLILNELTENELEDALRVLGRLAQELNNPAQNNLNFVGLRLVAGHDDEYDYDVEEPAAHYNAINFATELCGDAGVIDLKESQVPLLLDVVRALYLFENNKLKATDRKFDCLQKYLNGADDDTIAKDQGITIELIKKYIKSIINVIKMKFTQKELKDALNVILDLQDNISPNISKSDIASADTINRLNLKSKKVNIVQAHSASTEAAVSAPVPPAAKTGKSPKTVQVVEPSGCAAGTDYCSGEKPEESEGVILASGSDLPVIIGWKPLPVYTFKDAVELGIEPNTFRDGWRHYSLCSETDPDLFFPEKGKSNRTAKEVCGKCEVTGHCLNDALTNREEFGIWGGLSEKQRRRLLQTQSSS